MKVFSCSECNFRFQSDELKPCPRCGNEKTTEFNTASDTRRVSEGKEGWRDFHSNAIKTCPKCNGGDWDFNYKRKEKTCKKCGEVYPLPRRMV